MSAGVVEITSLERWGADVKAGPEGEALSKVVRFPYKPEYNARLVLAPQTGFERLGCDVIVVATNDTMDAPDCPHAAICQACGPEFQKATKALAPIKVTETRLVPVTNHGIGARFAHLFLLIFLFVSLLTLLMLVVLVML